MTRAGATGAGAGAAARILGIGVDLADMRRIERSIDRFGPRFLDRIYTAAEQRFCEGRRAARIAAYARRWAAKEACAKALGTGFAQGVAAVQIEVETLESGAPTLRLHGPAAAKLSAMTPAGAAATLHISLSDEPPFAQAFVVIEAAAPETA